MVLLNVDDSDGEECADVDEGVEDEHNVADGRLGIDDDLLTSLENLGVLLLVLVLVNDRWSHVRLEDTSTDSKLPKAISFTN